METRYALYFVPSQKSALSELGSALLGRDIYTDTPREQPDLLLPEGIDWCALTTLSRLYGIHATLKAPFVLGVPYTEKQLIQAFEKFCTKNDRLVLPRLFLTTERDFLALKPGLETQEGKQACAALQILADRAVRFFDTFRAPLSAMDIARRTQTPLTRSQEENLIIWGYPYVFSEYRFHIALSDSLAESEKRESVAAALEEYLSSVLSEPLPIDTLCLCRQDRAVSKRMRGKGRHGNFTVLHTCPLQR